MFVRNLLQAGDRVTVVPAGIRITLQYNDKGLIENVLVGYQDEAVAHPELMPILVTSNEIPSRVQVTKGTTFIYGCLYTGEMYKVEGKLSNAVEAVYVSKFIEDPSKFHFFAGHMHSLALGMTSPVAIQKWLAASGFNILPSYLVPAGLTEDNLSSMIHSNTYIFSFPRIQGYIIFRGGEHHFVSTNLRQIVVKKITKTISIDGQIFAEIESHDQGVITTTYADVVNFLIYEGSVLLINEEDQIVYCHNFAGQHELYSRKLTCSYCGRLIEIPAKHQNFTCENDHCVSVMYARVSRMLSKLGLSPIDEIDLKAYAKKFNNILTLPDILEMDEYKDSVIEIDLPRLLDAVVPSTIVTRTSDWAIFCNKCNNSIDSTIYYLQNPDAMMTDLELEPAIYRRLSMWLEDPENVVDVIGMINNPHIKVTATGKRFDGAPIFRGKSIFITGIFAHGNTEDIKAILSSYSALVYDKFNTAVDCVIIGGLHESIDGKAIRMAKQMQIPIFEEFEFFQKYEIDNDLKSSCMQ